MEENLTLRNVNNQLIIVFDTDISSIKYQTFNSSLDSISKILNNINQANNIDNHININYEFRLSNINHCCVEIITFLQPILPLVPSVFTPDNIDYVKSYINILIDIFKLKKIFKNKEIPRQVIDGGNQNNNIICDGDVHITQQTFKIYNNPSTQEELSKNFAHLDNDKEIKKFTLKTFEDTTPLEIENQEFKDLTSHKVSNEIDHIIINGLVTNLKSSNPDGSSNSVTIEGFINNTKAKVVANFNSSQYKQLIDAHKNKKVISLSGLALKQKRQYKINDVLTLQVN